MILAIQFDKTACTVRTRRAHLRPAHASGGAADRCRFAARRSEIRLVERDAHHTPVMVDEVLAGLGVQPGGRYIDATLGEGGHTEALLERSAPGGQVLALDADPEAVAIATTRLAGRGDALTAFNVNFRHIRATVVEAGFESVDGVLFDLGVSSLQLDAESRGFSFRRADPLDMRFSPDQQLTAADIVNTYSREELAGVIYKYGEERASRRIAAAIVSARPIANSLELADVVASVVRPRRAGRRIHPATRTFQALRIAVNDELGILESALEQAIGLLRPGGRLAVIAYHSLEDRIAKNLLRREAADCICVPGTPECVCGHQATVSLTPRRVIRPTPEEVRSNARSRSARLRVAERLQPVGEGHQ
ncbi:MAG: 16S rRNA (cytosine(1402)-N(4))-methyltransferase RsmH [Dehalococcoidia bacterium]